MIFVALLSSALSAPAYDAAQSGLITYHVPDYGRNCVKQSFIQGSTSAVVGTAMAQSNQLVGDYHHPKLIGAQGYVVSEQNQNYQIEIIANSTDDPEMLLSLFVGNVDANFHPGQWNAYVKFLDRRGIPVQFPSSGVPSEALYSSASPVLKKAYEKFPICPQ